MKCSNFHATQVIDLLKIHEQLDESLTSLRLSLFGGEIDSWFTYFSSLLSLHIAHEETWLLPIFAQRVPDVPENLNARTIVAEHHQLQQLLQAGLPGDLLAQGDRLSLVAGILEHHDGREAASFKPQLDNVLEPDERRSILDRIVSDWRELPGPPKLVLHPQEPKPTRRLNVGANWGIPHANAVAICTAWHDHRLAVAADRRDTVLPTLERAAGLIEREDARHPGLRTRLMRQLKERRGGIGAAAAIDDRADRRRALVHLQDRERLIEALLSRGYFLFGDDEPEIEGDGSMG